MKPDNRFRREDTDMLHTARMSTDRNRLDGEDVRERGGDGDGGPDRPRSPGGSLWGPDQTEAIK